MPNRVRIGPIKVNVINYQSVRRGGRVKLRGSHGSLAAACPDRPGGRGRRQWLDVSRLDLAVLFNVANTDGVDILPLVIEDLHVINVRQFKRPKGDISLRDLRGMQLIMAGRSRDLRDTLDDALFLATKQRLTVTAEVDSLPTIKQMVIAGLGSTVLPLANVQTELADGRLTARRIVRPAIERHASLVSLAHRPTTRAQKAVACLVVKVTAQLVSQGVWPARRARRS